ncbi:dynamin family protein [Skermania piniformis]|uniref:Dynamin family protein n=1 Tax=Skermania pinensis TaxID=39122 RepID=A0ABX8S4U2_9ACTN|nr:dynamin family protein [Skermania piniformis]QXQ12847.1 dynamin family protein [Skermania piniformis]
MLDETRTLVSRAIDVYVGTADAEWLAGLEYRLTEPLRVAVVGRVKAGKSTLLNALVGDRLAPTDAGECTRIATWYADGHTYRVTARLTDGESRQLRFTRDTAAITVDLAGLDPDQVSRLDVTWPSAGLRAATLIDTPGIGSLSAPTARRAWDLLIPADDEQRSADAVVYLLRHLHGDDVEFLRAFHDPVCGRPNPVNAIGVLSRADEIGGGRLDSMTSAGTIAARMSADPVVRRVVQTVVPVAGLLAETAATLTEREVAQLRRVAELDPSSADRLLLSADRFAGRAAPSLCPELGLDVDQRTALLSRFGLFGVRLATTLLRQQPACPASVLADELAAHSGIDELRTVLGSLFLRRADVLKSHSTLAALTALTRARPRPGSDALGAEVERISSAAHPLRELRVLSAVRSGWISGRPEVIAELDRLIGGGGIELAARLGRSSGAGRAELRGAAAEALERWQRRVENPMTDRQLVAAGRVVIRSCEGMLAELA